MIKKITLFALGAVSFILFNSYENGAPSFGATGSPGDGNVNCTRSGCHVGTATTVNNMISSDIPSTGWEANKTYNITFTISEASINKFGFQVTAEDGSGNKIGTFSATSATRIQNGGTHITHMRMSTAGSATKSWTFPWESPSKGSGKITFYGAGNAANGNGGKTGDLIKISSLAIDENTTTSVASYSGETKIQVFPTPTHSILNVNGVKSGSYKIYDLAGYTHLHGEFNKGNNTLDISLLHNGIYFLYSKNSELIQKIVKQ